MQTSQDIADTMKAGMAAFRTGVPSDYSDDQDWKWGWKEAERLARPTARQSVDAITNSDAFKAAATNYWSHAPKAKPDRRETELRGLRVFTEAQIADNSPAGHRAILDELQRIFARIEEWRMERSVHFSMPERTFILAALNRETALLDLAEIVEGV
ncbi:MAG: hypothetical protein Q7T86_03270 [Hyphomicrobiaceae bacterium]|nr:hypothetical protein [Hyphomicrobiaceae bacterium]